MLSQNSIYLHISVYQTYNSLVLQIHNVVVKGLGIFFEKTGQPITTVVMYIEYVLTAQNQKHFILSQQFSAPILPSLTKDFK